MINILNLAADGRQVVFFWFAWDRYIGLLAFVHTWTNQLILRDTLGFTLRVLNKLRDHFWSELLLILIVGEEAIVSTVTIIIKLRSYLVPAVDIS